MAELTIQVPSSQPGKLYDVTVVVAKAGEFAGQSYFKCPCVAGKYSWSPRGYVPCKHVRAVVALVGVKLDEGHFVTLPEVAAA